jgi:hypothetical protein
MATCPRGLSGTSQLTVNLTGAIISGPRTPANAASLFQAATTGSDTTREPNVEYPIDQAVTPLNIPPIEIQWTTAADDLFHVSLTSKYASINLYTSEPQGALSAADWTSLATTAAGGQLSIAVEGLLQSAPTTKYAGPSVALSVSHDTIDTSAIYYWASSQGNIMTQKFGDTSSPSVVEGNCTSCHSLSRTGSRIGYSRCVNLECNNLYVGFLHYDDKTSAWAEVVNADNGVISGSYTTFSPIGNPFATDAQSVAIVTMVNGSLSLYDPDTGTPIASNLDTVSTQGTGGQGSALMADWSPDGKTVVFASTPHPGQWVDLSDSSIATVTYTYTGGQHVFGTPQPLFTQPLTLPTGSYTNLFFPSFSSDGALVVFNASVSAWRDPTSQEKTGPRLVLGSAQGTWTTDLTALNGSDPAVDVTWPHWAPGNTTDYYWVVFSSEREYGHLLTSANTASSCIGAGVAQCKQIWIGAIDKKKLVGAQPTDPSAPPMWLPGQDIGADNISPYWTVPAGITLK